MIVSAIITLKKDVLDPQGKVIHQTLDGMGFKDVNEVCLLYTSPSPRDRTRSRMPSSA